MLLPKRNSLLLLSLLLSCCQKADLTVSPEDNGDEAPAQQGVSIVGTGQGTMECPFTVADIRSASLPTGEAVWVIGYMVGTAPRSLANASFSPDAEGQSNILLASDSLCSDPEGCIPVELSTKKAKADFSLPTNKEHFRKCLILRGIPSQYLYRKGLRSISTGLWMDGFDISSVAPQEWGTITL